MSDPQVTGLPTGGPSAASGLLADHTTLRVGGPAEQMVEIRDEAELVATVRQADRQDRPLLVVSGGSNLLVGDQGFPGLVVLVATQGITVTRHSDTVGLSVAAGQSWDRLVAWTVDQGWGGLEALSGIPGLVGAAPVQNIGAYGAEVASAIAAVTAWDRHTGQVARLGPAECRFGYRTSLFKQQPGRWVVLRVELTLRAEAPAAPAAYAELARRLGVEVGGLAPTSQVRQAVLDLRRGKGMVLDPADHDTWSAGSFFTNPIIEPAQAAGLPADAPRFPQPGGAIKTSAAWLIERAGFHKGYGPGPARLSTKHVLALTNRGGATAADLMDLACQVRDGVRQTYGIALVPEPVLVGLDLDRWPASGHRPTEGTR